MNIEEKIVATIEYDSSSKEYYFVVPETILSNLDWTEGDVIEYELDEYSTAVYMRKVN